MKIVTWVLALLCFVLVLGALLRAAPIIPVEGAASHDWNAESFWHADWGMSGAHKGIDIFAKSGTRVLAPVPGIVIYKSRLSLGGNVVSLLGPNWRVHYFAHMESTSVSLASVVERGQMIGKVGTTGNAVNKAPHLHYSIVSLYPRIGEYADGAEGWKRMFYLNPDQYLQEQD